MPFRLTRSQGSSAGAPRAASTRWQPPVAVREVGSGRSLSCIFHLGFAILFNKVCALQDGKPGQAFLLCLEAGHMHENCNPPL